MMLDDFEAAKHSWDLILEQGGDPISGRYMKSFCESRLGNKDQAVALYREALGMEEKGKTSPGYEQALWQQEKPVWRQETMRAPRYYMKRP